jgi:2-methylcitrate dehydratase PrpD
LTTISSDNVRNPTSTLAKFASDLTFDKVPAETVAFSKRIVLDTTGALLAASSPQYPAGEILSEFIKRLGGVEESTVIGKGFKSSCVHAALVNATMGYFCDMEPHHVEAITHTPAVIVPTCLAVGEREQVSGAEFLLSVILGVDVACRVSLALDARKLYARGFHPTAIAGSFGAAVAAGRLLGLRQEALEIAIGLAGNQASGLLAWKQDHTETSRPFNPGIAARNGVTAALLARMGFGGPPDIFGGKYNVFDAYSDGVPNREALVADLGTRFAITEHAFKLYACCSFLHPGLDGFLRILTDEALSMQKIDQVTLRFPAAGAELIDGLELRSHSAQYVFAVAASRRRVLFDDILHDRRSEPAIADFIQRVTVVGDQVLDPDFPDRYTSIVEVKTTDGRRFKARVETAKGTPQNPLTRREVEEKFLALSRTVIDDATAKAITELVGNIEALPNIGELGDRLRLSK